jgi:hypothetical protein
MTAREHAEELRQEAIRELLDEKTAIEEMLTTLGHDKAALPLARKRGRPRLTSPEPEIEQPPSQI